MMMPTEHIPTGAAERFSNEEDRKGEKIQLTKKRVK